MNFDKKDEYKRHLDCEERKYQMHCLPAGLKKRRRIITQNHSIQARNIHQER